MDGLNLRHAAALVFASALVACGPNETDGSKLVKSERVTASKGASIVVKADENPELAGTGLVIAPGALSADTTITLDLGSVPLVDSTEQAAGPVALWGPSGTVFRSPVQMTLPYKLHGVQTEANLFIQVSEANGVRFVIDHTKLRIDPAGKLVTFEVSSFSGFQPGSAPGCATDSQCGAGNVCLNGSCATQGTCSTNAGCAQNQVCLGGTCATCSGGVCPECVVDAHCGSGQVCVSGACTAGSLDGGPYDGGPHDGGPNDGGPNDGGPHDGGPYDGGSYDGGSYDGGSYDGGPECTYNSDCPAPEVCITNLCVITFADAGVDGGSAPCASDYDCSLGTFCVSGVCQP